MSMSSIGSSALSKLIALANSGLLNLDNPGAGAFLDSYVVSGGLATQNITSNNVVDVTQMVCVLGSNIIEVDAGSFQTKTASTIYYLDFVKNNFSWGLAHAAGTVNVDYLAVAEVTTDSNKNVDVITDKRGNINEFRLKSGYTFPEVTAISAETMTRMFNVRGYGAKGDGVTDDSVAINAAAKSAYEAGGGIVYYPAGTYAIENDIRLDNYNTLTNTYIPTARIKVSHIGAGAETTTIKVKAGARAYRCSAFSSFPPPWESTYGSTVAATDIEISHMTIDGNRDNTDNGGALYGANFETSPEATGGWPDGSISASFSAADNYQYGVLAYRIDRINIHHCLFKNLWFNGIEVYLCTDVTIQNNQIWNCGEVDTYLGKYSGIELDNSVYNVFITHNDIKDCGTAIMSNGDQTGTGPIRNITIAHNIIEDCESGIYAFDWLQDWTVCNNQFRNLSGNGIQFSYINISDGKHPKNIKIANNLINGFNTSNTAALAIRGQGQNFSIEGNTILQESLLLTANTLAIIVQDSTVVITSGASGSTVSDNIISGSFPGADENASIIGCAADDVLCSNNNIKVLDSLSYVAIGILGDNVTVIDNDIKGTFLYNSGKRAIYHASGTNPIVDDNKYIPLVTAKTTTTQVGLTASTWYIVNFDSWGSVDRDNRGNWDSTNHYFVADIPGLYRFKSTVVFVNAGDITTPAGILTLFELNGATSYGETSGTLVGGGTFTTETLIDLVAANNVSLKFYCDQAFELRLWTSIEIELIKRRT